MGADLYIRSISNKATEDYQSLFNKAVAQRNALPDGPQHEKAQEVVEKYYNLMYDHDGYFRDSYNATSLAWALGFSWWADVIPLLTDFESEDAHGNIADDDDTGNLLFGENLQTFRRMVAKEIKPDVTIERLRDQGALVDDDEHSPEAWLVYFEEKRMRLLRFIDTAIALDEPIYCSL
jgi:hypothetical protein